MTTPKKLKPERPQKPTQAELSQRVNQIHQLLVAGISRATILQHAADKWGCSERTADDYIARARVRLEKSLSVDRMANLSIALERLTSIFERTMRVQDYQRAIAAQRELNLLLGLYAPAKQDIAVRMTWEDEAVTLIKAGQLTYDTALETFDNDNELVASLFAKAQTRLSDR